MPRRPHPRVNLTQKDLGERVLVFGDKRGILRYIGKSFKTLKNQMRQKIRERNCENIGDE